jgi:hypothetical protein
MSDDLVAWLREQIRARMQLARAATPGPWEFEGDDPADDELYSTADERLPTVAWARGQDRQVANGRLMEANDPQDTIARCEAELAILDVWQEASQSRWDLPEGVAEGRDPDERMRDDAVAGVLDEVARLLAAGFRHCDGYARYWGDPVTHTITETR